MSDVRSVNLKVAGQSLSIRTSASDEELGQTTRMLESRIKAIKKGAPSATTAQVYLLAAMTIADDFRAAQAEADGLEELKAEVERLREQIRTQAQGALRFIDEDARND